MDINTANAVRTPDQDIQAEMDQVLAKVRDEELRYRKRKKLTIIFWLIAAFSWLGMYAMMTTLRVEYPEKPHFLLSIIVVTLTVTLVASGLMGIISAVLFLLRGRPSSQLELLTILARLEQTIREQNKPAE